MTTGKITKRTVDGTASGASDSFLWDEALKGFGLKVTKNGARTYLLQYRMGGRGSPTRRHTIGRHGSPWTPVTARAEAERLLSQIARGVDPRTAEVERKRIATDLAFDAYVDRYLREYGAKRWRPTTLPTVESNLRRYVAPVLGRTPLPQIGRSELASVFEALPSGKPALPRNVYAHTSKLFSWAVERGDIERSPFDGLKAPPTVASRERTLNDEEIRRVWMAAESLGYPFGPMIRLLLLTGQRRDEVAAMTWSECDRAAADWVLPAARAKNGKSHTVPLSTAAIAILDQLAGPAAWPRTGLLFTTTGETAASGHSRAKERLDRGMMALAPDGEFTRWRFHDLRRTLATGLQRLGVRFEVTEAVLNHVSGSRSGVAGVYQRHSWRAEKRAALDGWADHVNGLLAEGRE